MSGHLSTRSATGTHESADTQDTPALAPPRERSGSLVKFADGYDTNGDRYMFDHTNSTTTAHHNGKRIFSPKNNNSKSKNRTQPLDLTAIPSPAPRLPPRFRSEHVEASPDEDKTPLIKNQSAQIIDRWIGSATPSSLVDTDNTIDTMLTKDKHGHTRRISFDNPYLLFEDPTPFVPSIKQEHHPPPTRPLAPPPPPPQLAQRDEKQPGRPLSEYQSQSTVISHIPYPRSGTDEEWLSEMGYGTASDDDNNDYDSDEELVFSTNVDVSDDHETYFQHYSGNLRTTKTNLSTSQNAHQQEQQIHPLLAPAKTNQFREHDYSKNHTEQTPLIDSSRLERGDYYST
jgi:hypothetical protein